MQNHLLYLILFLSTATAIAQRPIIQLQDRLIELNADTPAAGLTDSQNMAIHRFWEIFRTIRDADERNRQLDGSARFGFVGNSNEDSEIYRINGGISIESGSFPQDFEFSTLLNIQINNGVLQENLSNLRISYDRFLDTKRDPFRFEGYSFINRRSDAFLDINQRYELGGGLILAFWKKKLLGASQSRYDRFNHELVEVHQNGKNSVRIHVDDYPEFTLNGIDSAAFRPLHQTTKRIANTIIKERSPLRLGILVGVFYEVESPQVVGTVQTTTGPRELDIIFPVRNNFRWEVRPSLHWRWSEEIYLKITPYFKFPLLGDWYVDVEGEQTLDARVDLFTSLDFKLSDRFTLSLDYTLYYDYAPASFRYAEPDALGVQYLTANQRHHYVSFQVGYAFR